MTDYGHELLFGSFLTPAAADPERVVALAQLSEQAGLDLVTVQDHPYQARLLDTWTLLSVIAARTTRVTVSPNVANLPLRPPAVLAKGAASLDLLTGGRVELGIGAGGFQDAVAAMGGPRLSPGESVEAFEEAVAVIRGIWAEDGPALRVEGRHHRVVGAHPGPAPAHRIGLWVGAIKPRMLRVTGRLGDGWLPSSPYVPPEQLPESNRIIDEAAEAAGRQPSDVRRLYNLGGRFQARAGSGFLQGPPELWAEQLAELTLEQGMSGYVVMGDDPDTLRRFASEVAPAVRELVEAGRSGAPAVAPSRETIAATVPATRPSLDVFAPTPDDGVRRSGERVWDESSRPTGPAPDPARHYTAHEVAQGRHLVDVHDHLRGELERVRELVEEVLAGSTDPGAARSQINTMTMRQNNWTLGVYCESYCRVVTTHHTIESRSMFPYLKRADPRLAPVVDRLHEEHEVIHDVLERVDRALVGFVGSRDASGDDTAKGLRATMDLLADTLLSHLSYEERELLEPLARLGFS